MTQEAIEKNAGRRRRGKALAEEVIEEEEMLEETDDDDDASSKGITERKGRATPGKRSRQEATEHRGNFIVRFFRGMRNYLVGVQEELDKVVWPTREELLRLSRIILVVTVFTAIILGIMAFVFNELFRQGFENNLLFLFFFIGVGVIYVVANRLAKRSNSLPY